MNRNLSEPPPLQPRTPLRVTLPRPPNLASFILLVIVLFPAWYWFFWRIEPGSDRFAVLIRKTGHNLASGQIIATEKGQKGIQLDVLSEGRYFKNPFTYGWEIHPILDIPAGKLGVQTRLYGKDLPPGQIIAGSDAKGIVSEVLTPGKYRINPYAYQVALFDAITIRPGYCGVLTSLVGKDVLNDGIPPESRNKFLVGPGMKGVQTNILNTGTYYVNPYMVNVAEVNLQSQRFEMSGADAITFLTVDGFTVHVEGTIEYALMPDKAALLTHQVGEMDDIIKKVVLPLARGFSRLEGSKNPAKNYIMGQTRQLFQNNLENHLREKCAVWGVAIRSVLIRNITPPDDIASIIRQREIAVQTAKKFEQQIEQAKSKAELTKQEMLALQNGEKVQAETRRIRAVIQAQQEQAVRMTAANQALEVAKLENDAATAQAQAILLKAGADRDVIRMNTEAEASVIASQIQAFGNGMSLARYTLYQRIGPRIQSVLTSDQEDGLGRLFTPYLTDKKEPAK